MFGKMMKWELRETAPIYGILYLLALVTALTCRSTGEVWQDVMKMNTAFTFLSITILATLAVYFVTVIWRYYGGLYRDRGYLTFSLPVKGWTIVLSRFLAALLWGVLSAAILAGIFWLMLQNQTFGDTGEVTVGSIASASFTEAFREAGYGTNTVIFWGIANLICSNICALARCFFCISLGQVFPFGKGNLVAAVVLYWIFGKLVGWICIGVSSTLGMEAKAEAICFSVVLLVFLLLYLIGAVYLVSRKTDLR